MWKGVLMFLSFFNFIASLVAVVGNSLVIYALRGSRSLHPPSKALLCCLALTDLLVGLYHQPSLAVMVFTKAQDSSNVFMTFGGKSYFPISSTTVGVVSLLTVTAIAMDRFLALHLGQRYRIVVTLRRLVALLVCFWIIAALSEISWTFYPYYGSVELLAIIAVCVLISSIAFAKVFLKLQHLQSQVQDHVVHNSNANSLNMARYRKSVENMVAVYILFVISYFPHGCIVGAVISEGTESSILQLLILVSITVLFFNSSLNPILYCWRIREIRQIVLQSLANIGCKVC